MIKKSRSLAAVLAVLIVFACFSSALAAETHNSAELENPEEMLRVIVELKDEPILVGEEAKKLGAADYLGTDDAQAQKSALLATQESVQKEIITSINANAKFASNYTNTVNGFSAVVKKGDISKIRALPDVKGIYSDTVFNAPDDIMETKLVGSTSTIGASGVMSPDGYSGAGMVVAVIDTGVDVNHEYMVLSDDTEEALTKESISSILDDKDLNAEEIISGLDVDDVYHNRKFPFCFDYADRDCDADCDGNSHGVEIAGVIAANEDAINSGNATNTELHFNGVAPEAQIIGMKIYSSAIGGATTSSLIAAIEDAISLGVDAINIGMGSPSGFTFIDDSSLADFEPEFALSIATRAGIVVSAPVGNESRVGEGSYINKKSDDYPYPSTSYTDNGTAGSPSTKYHSNSIASIKNTVSVKPYFYQDDRMIGYVNASTDNGNTCPELASLAGNELQNFDYVAVPGDGSSDDFSEIDVTGKIALIEHDTLSFAEQVENSEDAGAIGVILYSSEDNAEADTKLHLSDGSSIPCVIIDAYDGLTLKEAEIKTISFSSSLREGLFELPNQALMSDFSSWGCTPDLKLKPNMTAPGEGVYTTSDNNTYATVSGTSVSSAHVSGAAVLMKQYMESDSKFDDFTKEQKSILISSLLMNTADIILDENGGQYSPRRQGAGLINLEKAMHTNVYVLNTSTGRPSAEVGDLIEDEFEFSFDAYNLSDSDYTYKLEGSVFTERSIDVGNNDNYILPYSKELTHAEMLSDGHTINPSFTGTPTGTTNDLFITVPAGEKVSITVKVKLDSEETEDLAEIFDNGFFVEGFIKLNSVSNEHPDLNMPYFGYHGNWDSAPIIDGSKYFDDYMNSDGSRNYFYGDSCPYSFIDDGDETTDGYVEFRGNDGEGKLLKEYVAFSPNGDKVLDEIGYYAVLLRNAKQITAEITDSNNVTKKVLLNDVFYKKSLPIYMNDECNINGEMLPVWNGTDDEGQPVADGQYYYVIKACIDYPGASNQITKIPVIVDTEKPILSDSDFNADTKILTVSGSDGHYLNKFSVTDSQSEAYLEETLDTPKKSYTAGFDLSDFTGENVTLTIEDIAGNIKTHVMKNPNAIDKLGVTFDLNGGTIRGSGENIFIEIANGDCVEAPTAPIKAGFRFTGWYAADATAAFDFDTPITEATTLVAKYTASSTASLGGLPSNDIRVPSDKAETDTQGGGFAISTSVNLTNEYFKTSVEDKIRYIDISNNSKNLFNENHTKLVNLYVSGADTDTDIIRIPRDFSVELKRFDIAFSCSIQGEITIKAKPETEEELEIRSEKITNPTLSFDVVGKYQSAGINYDISVVQNKIKLDNSNKAVKVELVSHDMDDIEKAGVYTLDESGNLEYVMTYLNDDVISFSPPHFSPFYVLIYDKTFDDIKGHWAQSYIESMASKHVANGKSENLFDPNATITRAEFLTLAVRALGLCGQGKSTFTNIPSTKWYANYVSLAKDAGLIDGTEYNAEVAIPRSEMAAIISKAHAILNETTVSYSGTVSFGDVEQNSGYSEFIGYAAENGLINGFAGNLFKPNDNTTRAQAMTVIYRLITK